MSNIIACEIHDYFEAACVYRYQLKLKLADGETVIVTAIDITTDNNHEYLVIAQHHEKLRFNLSKIKNVTVLTENSAFNYFEVVS